MHIELKEGNDVTLFATGIMVDAAMEARQILAKDGVSAKVINIHTIKPLDNELIVKSAKETGAIVTAEEHSIIGGLGSAVAEAVTGDSLIRLGFFDDRTELLVVFSTVDNSSICFRFWAK